MRFCINVPIGCSRKSLDLERMRCSTTNHSAEARLCVTHNFRFSPCLIWKYIPSFNRCIAFKWVSTKQMIRLLNATANDLEICLSLLFC